MNENKVSVITVTKNRCNFLKTSIKYYLEQTHTNKEMLILYYSDDLETSDYLKSLNEVFTSSNNIRVFKHIVTTGTYLGSLRNYLVEKATGKYIIIWDDDDYHHPDRIKLQLEKCVDSGLPACTLRSLLVFSESRQEVRLSFERIEGWEGTLICKRSDMPMYRNIDRYEDTPVIDSLYLTEKLITLHNPDLYVYYLHDNNISTSLHKEELYNNSLELNGSKNYKIKKLIGFIR